MVITIGLANDTVTMFLDETILDCVLDYFPEKYPNPSGRILMGGLGLGLDTRYLLTFPEVSELVVVEKYKEVIEFTLSKWTHLPFKWAFPLKDERLRIVQADFFTYSTGGMDNKVFTYDKQSSSPGRTVIPQSSKAGQFDLVINTCYP